MPKSGSFYQTHAQKNPVKRSVSVRVEKMLKFCPVCQNKGGNDLAKWLPKGFISMRFSPRNLTHPGPGKAAGMRL